jgi:hypothetical protein
MSCQSQPTGGRRRSRKMRGGNGYGFGNPISVGAMEVVPNMTSVPNGAPYKPTGGRRRRRSRRRGGAGEPIYAIDTRKLVLQSECGSRPELWLAASIGFPSLPINFSEGIENPMRDGRPLGQCDMVLAASAPGGPGEEPVGDIVVGRRGKHKGGRRTRRKHRGRRRSMRGGGSVAGVGYGFTGSGERGMANQSPYPSNLPPSGAFAIPTGTR